jgi:hypothetical protein
MGDELEFLDSLGGSGPESELDAVDADLEFMDKLGTEESPVAQDAPQEPNEIFNAAGVRITVPNGVSTGSVDPTVEIPSAAMLASPVYAAYRMGQAAFGDRPLSDPIRYQPGATTAGYAQGITSNLADEALAYGQSQIQGGSYDDRLAQVRSRFREAEEGEGYTAGGVGGAITQSLFLPAVKAGQVVKGGLDAAQRQALAMIGRGYQAVGQGALAGYGAAETEEQEIPAAAFGGAVGGAFSAASDAIPVAANFARDRLGPTIQREMLNPLGQAFDSLWDRTATTATRSRQAIADRVAMQEGMEAVTPPVLRPEVEYAPPALLPEVPVPPALDDANVQRIAERGLRPEAVTRTGDPDRIAIAADIMENNVPTQATQSQRYMIGLRMANTASQANQQLVQNLDTPVDQTRLAAFLEEEIRKESARGPLAANRVRVLESIRQAMPGYVRRGNPAPYGSYGQQAQAASAQSMYALRQDVWDAAANLPPDVRYKVYDLITESMEGSMSPAQRAEFVRNNIQMQAGRDLVDAGSGAVEQAQARNGAIARNADIEQQNAVRVSDAQRQADLANQGITESNTLAMATYEEKLRAQRVKQAVADAMHQEARSNVTPRGMVGQAGTEGLNTMVRKISAVLNRRPDAVPANFRRVLTESNARGGLAATIWGLSSSPEFRQFVDSINDQGEQ